MLSQIYLGKNGSSGDGVDLHRHATFSCSLSRLLSRIAAIFGR